MRNEFEKIKIQTAKLSLFIGLVIFAIKIIAFALTNSSAIFSDAAESVVHILATGMVLYSIILSNRPPDKTHLYGHGNIEYFSAGIEGFLILVAAITIIYLAVIDLIRGASPNQLDFGTILIGASGLINLALGFYIVKKGTITNSLTLVADGKHILTDSYTSIGIVVGLVLVIITGYTIIDPIIAIFVALNIIFTGFRLMRESVGGLMMETDTVLLNRITKTLITIRKDYHIDIHQLRFRKSAEKVFVDFHLTLPYFFNIKESHNIEEELHSGLRKKIDNLELSTHFDFCQSFLCKYCKLSDCKVRKENFSKEIKWDSQKLLSEPIKE